MFLNTSVSFKIIVQSSITFMSANANLQDGELFCEERQNGCFREEVTDVVVFFTVIYFWKNNFLDGDNFFFIFSSSTSVLLLEFGCRPPASNKGWFMQMDKEGDAVTVVPPSILLSSVCTPLYLARQPRYFLRSSPVSNKDVNLSLF